MTVMNAVPARGMMAPSRSAARLLAGVVPPLVTPFTAGDEVDHRSLAALCEYLIDAGVDGVYPCGTTGECVLLTGNERKAIAETVVAAVRGRVPVYVHVGAASTKETVALARHAAAVGADGVGAVTPFYFAYGDDELERHYLALAEAVAPLPVYLYNLPSYARNRVSPAVAAQVRVNAPNIAGIKDSSGDLDALRAFRTIPAFSVLSGTDGLNLEALRLGCDGMISGNANAAPEPFVTLCRAWRAGDLAAAEAAQRAIDAARHALGNGARLADFKAVLVARGVLATAAVRAPHPPAHDGEALLAALAAGARDGGIGAAIMGAS